MLVSQWAIQAAFWRSQRPIFSTLSSSMPAASTSTIIASIAVGDESMEKRAAAAPVCTQRDGRRSSAITPNGHTVTAPPLPVKLPASRKQPQSPSSAVASTPLRQVDRESPQSGPTD
eukprot:1036491-Prymnesium_polylepis.2